MRIAFLVDRLASIDPTDETTSHLMHECNERGHQVLALHPLDLWVCGREVTARMCDVSVQAGLAIADYWRLVVTCQESVEPDVVPLAELDVVFTRTNPPIAYRAVELLDALDGRLLVVNRPRGQLVASQKSYVLSFPDLIPETHVSRDPGWLRQVIDHSGREMVVKPLSRFGGEGVIKVSARDPQNLDSLLHYYVGASRPHAERDPVMVQEYLPEVTEWGDVRVLMLDGEILGAMGRLPRAGDFRANVHAGATTLAHDLSPGQRLVCETVADRLRDDGLYFVGLDLIGDRLVEVNCLSPGGLTRINRLHDVRLQERVVDFVETRVRERVDASGLGR